jgi:tRNA nucleotidyltransferase (CCA-adding enzyme)
MYNKIKEVVSPLYEVGGSIRDQLLGIEPKDYDFTTPLTPDEIEQRVRDYGRRPYLTGKRFGTVGFKMDGKLIEVTTFRSECYEEGNRKPVVRFVKDITADLSRRDFTINAMARRDGKLIDPFGGRTDLESRLIRAVGVPKHRFREDPLRMLRAARFVAKIDAKIEEKTKKAIFKMSHNILSVSKERWVVELDKLLSSNKPSTGLNVLADTRLLNYIIPELSLQVGFDQNSEHHSLTLWNHTLATVDACPPELRWGALLHDIAKPFVATPNSKGRSNYIHHGKLGAEMVWKIARYLKWSNDKRESVIDLVLNHLSEESPLREFDNKAKKIDT